MSVRTINNCHLHHISPAGSAANGVGEADSLLGKVIAGSVTKIVGAVADAAVDKLGDEDSED